MKPMVKLRSNTQNPLLLNVLQSKIHPQNGKLACFLANTRSFPRDTSGGESMWLARGMDGLKGSLGTTLGKTRDLHLEEVFGEIISNSFSPSVLLMLFPALWGSGPQQPI